MIRDQDLQLIKDTFKGLRRTYDLVERTSDIPKETMDFLDKAFLLSHYTSIDYYNAYSFKTADDHEGILFTVFVSYTIRSGKFNIGGFDIQLLALRELPAYFGRILIRPETIPDKIAEWFERVEIDFPGNPGFSRRNYFLSDDNYLAKEFATERRLSELEKYRDIFMEINGNLMLAKFQRVITFHDGCALIDLMKNL